MTARQMAAHCCSVVAHALLTLSSRIEPGQVMSQQDWDEIWAERTRERGGADDPYVQADDSIDRLIGRCFDLANALDADIIDAATESGVEVTARRATVMRVSAAVGLLHEHGPEVIDAMRDVYDDCMEATGLVVVDE